MGVRGRPLCCLSYEDDFLPRQGYGWLTGDLGDATLETKDGTGQVVSLM